MTKEELLKELAGNTWAMIKPSALHGVGVYAIREIPKGCREIFSRSTAEWVSIPRKRIEELPFYSRQLVETYCLFDEDNYFVPEYGFKMMDMVIFLNHSDSPNIVSVNEGEYFMTIRDIKEGEEILINYGDIVEEG